jgi:hypothetical protein
MATIFGDPRMPERFWRKVVVNGETGCWEWTGAKNANGYGLYVVTMIPERKAQGAHRAAFIALRFDPEELVCDHLCRVRHCVNPDHMRAVTHRVNILAGIGPSAENARKTHCSHGHEYTPENTLTYDKEDGKSSRNCRACETRKTDRSYAPRRQGHGTAGKYRSGCRCRECKDQQRDRMRTYRASRPNRSPSAGRTATANRLGVTPCE